MRTAPAIVREDAPRLVGLEALRFVAALAVVIWHYHHFYAVGALAEGFVEANQPFHTVLALVYEHGNHGVYLFWCLSGFLFAWKYADPIGAGSVSFRHFAARRFSRLYPLHLATLLAVAALQLPYVREHGAFFVFPANDIKHFLLGLGFASHWGWQDGMSFNGPSWSVSVEIPVYLFFFAECRLMGAGRRRSVMAALVVFLAATLATPLFPPGFALPAALAYFHLGVLTRHLHGLIAAQRGGGRIALDAAVLIVAGALTTQLVFGRFNALLMPALILLFQRFVPDHSPRASRVLTGLGDLTYASYMLHFPLQLAAILVIERLGLDKAELFASRSFFLGYLAVVLILSRVVFLGFERPAQTWLRRLAEEGGGSTFSPANERKSGGF